jgi:hypothetical protein
MRDGPRAHEGIEVISGMIRKLISDALSFDKL